MVLATAAVAVASSSATAQLPPPPTLPVDTSGSAAEGTLTQTVDQVGALAGGKPPEATAVSEPPGDGGRPAVSEPPGDGSRPTGSSRQPRSRRPRISVRKTNDADQDGTFSQEERASRPQADVRFWVRITNRGNGAVQIEEISDSFRGATLDVCSTLIGDQIPPDRSVTCTFELDRYAPPRYDTVANTVSVVVSAAGEAGPGGTGHATSTVITPGDAGGAEVLGEQITREPQGAPNPGSEGNGLPTPALTGLSVLPLASLALLLALTGSILIGLGRRLEGSAARPLV
jgi:hypothetical protein